MPFSCFFFFLLKFITPGKDGAFAWGAVQRSSRCSSWYWVVHQDRSQLIQHVIYLSLSLPHSTSSVCHRTIVHKPLAVVQIGCLALCAARMGSIKAVVWYNGLIGVASTEPTESRKNTFGRMRERNEWKKTSQAWKCNESELSRPCAWLCGAVWRVFQHMWMFISLKWSMWTQGPFGAKREDFRSKARPSQARRHAEKLTTQCFICLQERTHVCQQSNET